MSASRAAITLQDLRVHLSGTEILHGITTCIPRGSLVALVGPNGAGKSTLLRAASAQLPLSAGHIEVNGKPLHRLSRRQIARSVCLLPQDVSLTFPFSVQDVVAMGRNPHLGRFQRFSDNDKEIVGRAMGQTSIEHLAERLVTELSGGEKQRTLLARSLATEAPTLLLDEPTTSLDIHHELEVLELLQQFAQQGKTVVAAMHDLNAARRTCSHILLLHNGKLAAEGNPEETLSPHNVSQVFGIHVSAEHQDGLVFSLPKDSRSNPTVG